jgi:hypothetical protein
MSDDDGAGSSPLDAELTLRLRGAGIQRLPAVFMFPVAENGERQWCRYPVITQVSWRDSSKPFYVRSAGIPFDIVPLRPRDPARAGSWYSLGPALDGGTLHHRVLLAQLIGHPAEVAKRREFVVDLVRQACAEVPGEQVRISAEATDDSVHPDWVSHCLAVVLDGAAES